MKTKLFLSIALSICGIHCFSQSNIQEYYKLALQYKDGNGVAIDYVKAYGYFAQASRLGDAQSSYALGYMQYKGLGCTQDYVSAASAFKQGAIQGRENSMYFYALCWRNGYGIEKNEDSARYWLIKADSLGYKQAALELKMLTGENENDSAKALVVQISNAAIPDNAPLNRFTKVSHYLSAHDMLPGQYMGWLVQYDWSGQNVVGAKRLMVTFKKDNDKFTGTWVEGTDTAAITATLSATALMFNDTKYKRKDHYSPDSAVAYEIKGATLNMVQQNDSLFLAGNITMFSPERKEPSKPLFVALSRKLEPVNMTATILKASPNPFSDVLNVDLQLMQAANVEIQLISINGSITYRNLAGLLQAGHYLLPLRPGFIASGTYLLKLVYGNQSSMITVMKQ